MTTANTTKRTICHKCNGWGDLGLSTGDDRPTCPLCNGDGELTAEFAQKVEDGECQKGTCDECGVEGVTVVLVPGLYFDEMRCAHCYDREEEPEPLDEEDLAFVEQTVGLCKVVLPRLVMES